MIDQDLFDFIHCCLRCALDELEFVQAPGGVFGESDFVDEGLFAVVTDQAVGGGTEVSFGPVGVECGVAVCTSGEYRSCSDVV